MANKKYNLNEMREVLIKSHNTGNKALITKNVCADSGVSEVFFKDYLTRVEALHSTVCDYVRTKHASNAQIAKDFGGVEAWTEQLAAKREAIFPLWKNLLECGEKDKIKKSLHVNVADVDSIVGYAEMFMDKGNNQLEAEEEITFPKVIACVQLNKFRKQIETLLGIRIAEEEVLSDARRDYLIAERKLITRIKRTREKIESLKKEINDLERFKGFIKNAKEIERIDGVIAEKTTIISGVREDGKDNLETQLDDAITKLDQLHANENTVVPIKTKEKPAKKAS